MENALVPAPAADLSLGALGHSAYVIRRPFWSIFGRKFNVFAPDGSQVMFVKHPVFKLKPEFTVCTDETEKTPLFVVRSRTAVALNRVFDVTDARSGEKLGTIRSRGLKSILRDTWDLLDGADQPIGLVTEDGAALLRRFFPLLLGKWHVELNGQTVVTVRQHFKFFIKEFGLDLSANQGRLDPRVAVACAMLALMAETAREASK